MKKVFLVYASAGAGHQKAAEAVYQYLKDNHPELEVRIFDLLDYTSPFFKSLYSRGYVFLISKLPWLWYLLYRISFLFYNNKIFAWLDYNTALPFVDLLLREKPDAVVSTHFMTSSIISVFKNCHCERPKLVSIITDYNLHPLWIGEGVDLYITACDFVRQELLRRKVVPEKIRVLGIPAQEKFYRGQDRSGLARKFGIDPLAFTALVITGAVGIGPIEEIVRVLAGEVQLLVVCGRNRRLYQRLSGITGCHSRESGNPVNLDSLPRLDRGIKPGNDNKGCVRIVPFPLIDYVDELMSVSDAVITKAGGLTITESLAKKLPMVFFSNIPGLESANARVLVENGCAFDTSGIAEIRQRVLSLKNNPAFYQETVSNIARFRKEQTLAAITEEVKNVMRQLTGAFCHSPA